MFEMVNRLINKNSKEGDKETGSQLVKGFVEDELKRRVNLLEEKFHEKDEERIQKAYRNALEAFRVKQTLGKKPKPQINLYLTDYTFLSECYRFLTETEEEGFCLVTGPEIEESIYALTRRIDPEMGRQSRAGAEPEIGSLTENLEEIDAVHGEHLSGYFHSHPGRGKGSTAPSGIDLSTQERLERGGYPVVGCIFSRDGYLRFYSHQRTFQLEISGKGGESVGEKVYKLSQDKVHKVS